MSLFIFVSNFFLHFCPSFKFFCRLFFSSPANIQNNIKPSIYCSFKINLLHFKITNCTKRTFPYHYRHRKAAFYIKKDPCFVILCSLFLGNKLYCLLNKSMCTYTVVYLSAYLYPYRCIIMWQFPQLCQHKILFSRLQWWNTHIYTINKQTLLYIRVT